jgi:hypothetical protein
VDPSIAKAIAEVLGPALGLLVLGAIPASLVFMSKYFKLKTREMELDAELHGRELEARLRALESRQGATESAVTALSRGLGVGTPDRSLFEAPPESSASVLPERRMPEK